MSRTKRPSGTTTAAAPRTRPTHAPEVPRRRRPDRRPADPDRRGLRRRRRRQDHQRRGARAAGGRGGPQGRGADHRPGPPAGPVARGGRAGQHPAAGARHRHRQRRQPRRDDAGHEADLRRGRAGALDARDRRVDPGEPVLRRPVVPVRRDAGVHGDGEARPAARGGGGGRHLGPDRRRHPAGAFGAGLPGCPRAPQLAARRPLPQGAAGRRARTVPTGQRGLQPGGGRAEQDPRRSAADRPADLHRRLRGDLRRLPPAGQPDVPAARLAADDVPGRRHPAARRAAGGGLLRRPAERGEHAAGRRGGEPGQPEHPGRLGRAVTGPGRRSRSGHVRRRDRRPCVSTPIWSA